MQKERANERVDGFAKARLSPRTMMQELKLFLEFLYKKDETGAFLYVYFDGELTQGVFVPWTNTSKGKFSRSQCDIFRKWMLSKGHNSPLVYHSSPRRWNLDIGNYPKLIDALDWLSKNTMTTQEWLLFSHETRLKKKLRQ